MLEAGSVLAGRRQLATSASTLYLLAAAGKSHIVTPRSRLAALPNGGLNKQIYCDNRIVLLPFSHVTILPVTSILAAIIP
jgi:hypothetical protein